MLTRRRAPAAAALAAVIAMTAITGCSTQMQGDMMTPDEAQTELVDLADRIQGELGGEWENQDRRSPMSCDVRGGGEGVQFAVLRLGTGAADMAAADRAASAVTKILTAADYEIVEAGEFR